ncbi:MAG TPA: flagella basal body P-ring formation protein FlgA [Candidatus Sulfotelmatobacter sp.]
MKTLAVIFIHGILLAAPLPSVAQRACTKLVVKSDVQVEPGELTLASLLVDGACTEWREAAAQVSLGASPRAATPRVLEGSRISDLLANLVSPDIMSGTQVPQRIQVRQAGAVKSCGDIARQLNRSEGLPDPTVKDLNCAALPAIASDEPLELMDNRWNEQLHRREFVLRCVRRQECVPFLLWTSVERSSSAKFVHRMPGSQRQHSLMAGTRSDGASLLVKLGQTATLTWDRAGIRIVLRVTCLEAGSAGQMVRVRFKNVNRVIRAEVMSDGTLRVGA